MPETNPFKEEKETTSNQVRFKNAICYIPLIAIILFLVEEKKTEELKRHISYGIILFCGYIVFSFVLYFLHLPFTGILGFFYLIISGYLGFMAYNGKNIEIEQFTELEKQIKQNMDK